MVLYNWFGGSYDGGNYYIKNLNIDSPCYNVGLFGTTAGADIRNIVLYSDNNAVIQRRTEPVGLGKLRGRERHYALPVRICHGWSCGDCVSLP